MRSTRNIPGVVVASQKSYGFYYVAQEISRTLGIPLVDPTADKLKYLTLFLTRPSFIISVGTLSPKKLIALSMASKRVVAYIAVEGPFPIPKPLLWLANNTNRLLVVAPSNYVKRELSSSGLKVLGVIPHGINLSEVRLTNLKVNLPPDKFKILAVVTSLQRRKFLGIYYLFRAWSKLPRDIKKDSVLILKVPSGTAKYISKLAESLGFRSNEYMILDAHFTRDEMFALYRFSDLYIHSTLSDGFGLPVIESLICGTPVVAMNAEPWSEIVSKEVGWLVKVSKEVIKWESNLPYRLKIPDLNDFSEKLINAIEYCERNREALREKCIAHAQAFDARKLYKNFEKLIECI
ncbi:MAG: glycosyltransferase [Thermofilaceae archaeon]